MGAENYVLGRGEVHFAPFKPDTQIPDGYRYIGNTPEFSMTLESEKLDHYNSDRGIREKDASVVLEVSRSLTIVTDEITTDNLAMFFFSADGAESVSDAGTTITDEQINAVKVGRSYQLGESVSNPVGNMNIAVGATVKDDTTPTAATFVAGTDYVLDAVRGILTILDGGAIDDGTNLRVTYTTSASTHKLVVSGGEPVNGALKFVTKNPAGNDFVYTMPWVQISPNGDFNLKGDEWQQIPLTGEILRKSALEAIYLNGLPFTPAP